MRERVRLRALAAVHAALRLSPATVAAAVWAAPAAAQPRSVDPPAAPGPDSPRAAESLPSLDVMLAAGSLGRRFEYRNGISGRPYVFTSAAAPAARLEARFFPLSSAGGPWSAVGVAASYEMVFLAAPSSSAPTSYSIAALARIPLGAAPRIELEAAVGYAVASFGAVGPAAGELPAVSYRALRPALDVRVPFGRVAALAGTAARLVVDSSAVTDQLYRPAAVGFDAHAGASLAVLRWLELRVLLSYTRFVTTASPPPRATFGPGGAVDAWVDAALAVAYVR